MRPNGLGRNTQGRLYPGIDVLVCIANQTNIIFKK